MSGLAGIFLRDGRPLPAEWLDSMRGALRHRGPDGEGMWKDGCAGLVHCSFHTTPESVVERQPLEDDAGAVVLAADARIDNRDELVSRLGGLLRTDVATDADLILAAYRKWGGACAEHLIGPFAAVLWDGEARQVVCLRDHAGLRPLYYYLDASLFAVASEIKALFEIPIIPRRINEERIAAHLTTIFPRDPTMTWFEDIVRMPPAHVLKVGPGDVSLRRYWQLDPRREIRLPSDAAYVEAFREHFTEAVSCRLRSTTPVGSTVSGGMDSSAIACVARDLLTEASGEPLHTFSAIFPDVPEAWRETIDERKYIAAVHETGSFEPHFIRADKCSPLWQYDKIAWHLDEPIWGPNLYLHLAMYERAHQHGIRVLLDGIDGDSVVSHGFEYLAELFYGGEWPALEEQVEALSQRSSLSPAGFARTYLYPHLGRLARKGRWRAFYRAANELSRRFDISRREMIMQHLAPAVMGEAGHARWQSFRGRQDDTLPLLSEAFAARLGCDEGPRGFTDVLEDNFTTARDGHIHFLADVLFGPLFELADRASGAFEVEPRYPFFDRRLMEFCVALPVDQKIRRGWTRYILRRAMDGILPPEVQWREAKAHLGGNFVRNMWSFEKQALQHLVSEEDSPIEPYVNMSSLRTLYERARRESGSSMRSGDTRDLYTALTLRFWFKNGHVSGS